MYWQAGCVPCFFNQVISLGKTLNIEEHTIRQMLKELASIFSTIEMDISPPEFAILVYSLIKEKTGISDPYEAIKDHSNRVALELYQIVKEKIRKSKEPLLTALFTAIAGNIIDYGVRQDIDILSEINQIIKTEAKIEQGHFFHISEFINALQSSKTILYLGDNCGEAVFDKLFIEEILSHWTDKEITFVVRGGPIINDVTMREAQQIGLNKICKVISSGVPAPGTILKLASKELIDLFYRSDMIISKGQGNFESLSDVDKKIFFLFMAKCDVVANFLECKKGQILLI